MHIINKLTLHLYILGHFSKYDQSYFIYFIIDGWSGKEDNDSNYKLSIDINHYCRHLTLGTGSLPYAIKMPSL